MFYKCLFLSTDYYKRSAGYRYPETGIYIAYIQRGEMNFCFTLLSLVLLAHGGTRNISTLSAVFSEVEDSLTVFISR